MARWLSGQSSFRQLLILFNRPPHKCIGRFGFTCKQALSTALNSTAIDVSKDAETKELKKRLKEEKKQRVKERYYKELDDYRNRKPPTPEEALIERIERSKRKVAIIRQMLKPYQLPESNPADHDPEMVTPEQLHYLRKIGRRNQNYVTVGKRGIYGGTIQNMHLNWKKHETVRMDCHMFPFEQVKDMAQDLAKLSGGIVTEIIRDKKIVILYRGKNYQRPEDIIPKNTLDKRKALIKAQYEESMYGVLRHISRLERELSILQQNDGTLNPPQQQSSSGGEIFTLCSEESTVGDRESIHEDEQRHESHSMTDSDNDWMDDTGQNELDTCRSGSSTA